MRVPVSEKPAPVVLMLNKAMGDRTVYKELADALFEKGIASLRLDLPGHGESVNLGKFVPGKEERSPMIWDAEKGIIAAHQYLKNSRELDSNKICIIGASYSGEEMAEAGRVKGYAKAYVAFSPGSFTDKSIHDIDSSRVSWLFVVSNNERYLKGVTASVQVSSRTAELMIMPGAAHASDILINNPGLVMRIAIWIEYALK
jgi:dienelactone hydrolase